MQIDSNDDYPIEMVELSSGKFLNDLIIDTTNGAIKLHRNLVTRDWVVGYDSIGRTLIYSLKTGQCTAKFFGDPRSISSSGTPAVSAQYGTYGPVRSRGEQEGGPHFPIPGLEYLLHARRKEIAASDE